MEVSVHYRNEEGKEDVYHLPLKNLKKMGKMYNHGSTYYHLVKFPFHSSLTGNHYFPFCMELDENGNVKRFMRTINKWYLSETK